MLTHFTNNTCLAICWRTSTVAGNRARCGDISSLRSGVRGCGTLLPLCRRMLTLGTLALRRLWCARVPPRPSVRLYADQLDSLFHEQASPSSVGCTRGPQKGRQFGVDGRLRFLFLGAFRRDAREGPRPTVRRRRCRGGARPGPGREQRDPGRGSQATVAL